MDDFPAAAIPRSAICRRFPFDKDQVSTAPVVINLGRNPSQSAAIVRAVIGPRPRPIESSIVAEGVETQEQLGFPPPTKAATRAGLFLSAKPLPIGPVRPHGLAAASPTPWSLRAKTG